MPDVYREISLSTGSKPKEYKKYNDVYNVSNTNTE